MLRLGSGSALLGADGTTRWARGHSAATARAIAMGADDRIEVVGSNSGDAPEFDTRFWRYESGGDVACEVMEGTGSSSDNGRAIATRGDAAFVASDVRATDQAAMLSRFDEDCVPHFEARVENVAASLPHDLALDAAAGLLYSSTTQIWDEAAQAYRYQGVVRTYDLH